MSKRPAAAQVAYVLHHYDWSETSLVLDLFTRDLGRIAVVAKGAKRPYSQLRSVLLPFQRLNVSLGRAHEGPSEVQNLRHAEWAGGLPMLSGASLFSGFYLNELLMRLLVRHDPHMQLFDAYVDTLPALSFGGDAEQAALRAFELMLLRQLGLLPDLSGIAVTHDELQADHLYALHPEVGLMAVHGSCDSGCSGSALIALQAALQHGSMIALQTACLPVLSALRSQLRHLLHYHLGSSQLRTRRVMLDAQRLFN